MRKAAVELGLRVAFDLAITLPDGRRVPAAAYFPDLGTPGGMYVVAWEGVDVEVQRQLQRSGAAAALIPEPSDREPFELDNFVEMFREWGWSATDRDEPSWMTTDDDGS